MLIFKRGDLFDAPGIHIVTASSALSMDGTLVMGMGAAYAMKVRHPGTARIFGDMVKEYCGHEGIYGLLIHGSTGILQTRRHYQGPMDPDLIRYGLRILQAFAEGRPDTVYNLVHPGMRFDRTRMEDIEKAITGLPGNVHIWEKR